MFGFGLKILFFFSECPPEVGAAATAEGRTGARSSCRRYDIIRRRRGRGGLDYNFTHYQRAFSICKYTTHNLATLTVLAAASLAPILPERFLLDPSFSWISIHFLELFLELSVNQEINRKKNRHVPPAGRRNIHAVRKQP